MKVNFIARTTRPVDLGKTKTNAKDVAKVSVAENFVKGKDPQDQTKYLEGTSFFNLEAYWNTALRLSRFPQGTLLHIEGDLTNESYKDSAGETKSWCKILINRVSPIKYLSNEDLSLGGQNTAVNTAPVNNPTPVNTAPQAVLVDEEVNFDFSQV